MTAQLLIRDIPDEISTWITEESHRSCLSKKEFVLDLLRRAHGREEALPLFDLARPAPTIASQGVPFTFIDLFAGIGGLRMGLEAAGGRCLFSCEWDKHSQKTYRSWFGETPAGDIRKILPAEIPAHDVLAAGFPCQPFSIAGVSKKKSLGRAHGFRDVTQGTLFFYLATLIEVMRPPVLLLENVKNLKSHDKGRTWDVIIKTLKSLNYAVFSQVIDAAAYVPQHRERVFIVCFNRSIFGAQPSFDFPKPPDQPARRFRDILDPATPAKYTLTDHLWNYLQQYALRHKALGNGFGFGLADPEGVSRTLSARYYKDGSEILIRQPRKNPRRLTPREAARLMGFDPDRFPIVVSDTQAYRQFGNAVVPPVAEAVAREIVRTIASKLAQTGCLNQPGGQRRNQASAC
jgi:DNA (cytosine-5)-methyltransferase 1